MQNECICERPLLVDERVFDMGYMCSKCGKNADNRVIGYLNNLGIIKIKQTSKRVRLNERKQ